MATFTGALNVNTRRVLLGSWDSTSKFLAGTIDDVAVYAKVLTAGQVADHFARGAPLERRA